MMLSAKLVEEAKKLFGSEIVAEVIDFVELSDPDGAYTHYEDMGMFLHAHCLELLYFENED